MRVAIAGASGLIGSALRTHLSAQGHDVTAITRPESSTNRPNTELRWNPATGEIDATALIVFDAVVNLAGAGIGAKRWSKKYRRTIVESRLDSTDLLATTLAALDDGPQILINASAVGFYGDRGDKILDENSGPGTGFLPDLVQRWEAATAPAERAGFRVAHARTGIVLSPNGGALKKMLPLFKHGTGGRFGNGRQWMPWISITDEVRAIEYLLTNDLEGPFNLTAPNPVRNSEFAHALGDALGRPAIVPVPAFGPRLLLGCEKANALLFEGQRAEPAALLNAGFVYQHHQVSNALQTILRDE